MNIITNKTLLLIVISLTSNFLFSQNKITGQIIDHENSPIEFATISLLSQNNIPIKTELSDQFGKFEIQEKQGNYILEITFLGKSIFKENINLNENKDLGIIQIENSEIIEQVTIVKEKKLVEKKVDRLVFNVENSILSTGVDVMDVLKIVPRIRVQNDEISMIGKGNMAVMIDGRMTNLSGSDLADYLKTFRSDDIKSIEVITNPPAKYSAEGNSGIINIVTKKQKLDNWNIPIRTVYQQSTYPMGLGGLGFNLRKDKVTLTSSFSYTEGSIAPQNGNIIEYPNSTWDEINKQRSFTNRIYGRLGLDYKISDKIYNGFIYNYSNNKPERIVNSIINISNPQTNNIDSLIVTNSTNPSKQIYNSINYHFVYDIDTLGRELSFDFDFFDYQSNSERIFQAEHYLSDFTPIANSFESANSKGKSKINNYSFNLDMEHPLDWIDLNYGGRFSFTNTDNNFEHYDITTGIPIFDTSQSNTFEYKENTKSVYFSAKKKFSEKLEAKTGLRLESTQLKGFSPTLNQENKIDYTELFPSAYLLFNPNDNHSFSLNYSRRINRPSYSFLNPFRWVSSKYSYSEGNPYLQPSFSNNVEFEYTFKENYISTLYFSHTDNGYQYVTILDDQTKVQQNRPLNFMINKSVGFGQNVIIKPSEWMELVLFGHISYNETDSKIPTTLDYLSGWAGYFFINGEFMLNKEKTFMFNLSYSHNTKAVDGLDHNSYYSELNAVLRASFLERKLTVVLYASDIFNTSVVHFYNYSNNIKNTFKNFHDNRFIRLSVNYNFGKQFGVNQRETKNSEDVNRAN